MLSSASRWQPYVVVVATSAQGGVVSGLVPPLLEDWGYSVGAIGLLIATASVAALLSRLPGGLLYASGRAHWLLLGSILLTIVASVLHPLATDTTLFVVARVLFGLSTGVATTVNLAVFSDSQPPGRARQRALGYYSAGVAVGFTIGASVAGFAADWLGTANAFALGAAFGVIALLGVPLRAPTPHADAPADVPFRVRTLAHPRLLSVLAIGFSLFLLFGFWNAYLPLYGLAVGLTLGQIGLVRGAFALCQVGVRPLSGALVGHSGAGPLVLTGLGVQAVMIMLVPTTSSLTVLLVLFVIHGSTRALAVVANTVSMVEGAEEARVPRGVMAGLYNTSMDLGSLVGPALGGGIASLVGVPASFVVVPVITLVMCAAAVLASRASARAVVPG